MCAKIEKFGLESAENRGNREGSDQQITSLSELERQTTKATGEISVSSDRKMQPIGPKSPCQSHTNPSFEVDGPRQPISS